MVRISSSKLFRRRFFIVNRIYLKVSICEIWLFSLLSYNIKPTASVQSLSFSPSFFILLIVILFTSWPSYSSLVHFTFKVYVSFLISFNLDFVWVLNSSSFSNQWKCKGLLPGRKVGIRKGYRFGRESFSLWEVYSGKEIQ